MLGHEIPLRDKLFHNTDLSSWKNTKQRISVTHREDGMPAVLILSGAKKKKRKIDESGKILLEV